MFFTIIGFLGLVVGMCFITLAGVLICANSLGKWNIGGVENGFLDKALAMIALIMVVSLWYLLYKHMPFLVTYNTV